MNDTLDMSKQDIEYKKKQQDRERQQRFYNANKERVNANRKIKRDSIQKPNIDDSIQNITTVQVNVFGENNIINMINSLPMNEYTRKRKIANVKLIFTAYPSSDLKHSVNNFDEMKYRIENLKTVRNPELTYSHDTLKNVIQTILWCIVNIKIPVNSDTIKQYEGLVNIMKMKASHCKIQQQNDEDHRVIKYSVYLDKIRNAFGEKSKQYLIASIYNVITMRDDLASVNIVGSMNEINDINNYIVIPKTGNSVFVLQAYKTQNKYGKQITILPEPLTSLIREYIIPNKLTDRLFPTNYDNGLTQYIHKMNEKIGVNGSINEIRRMKITDFLQNPNLTLEDMNIFATNNQHSIQMLNYYKYLQKD